MPGGISVPEFQPHDSAALIDHLNGIPVRNFFVRLIRTYQRFLSPLLPPSCRFHPTCSQYAIDAITCHGAYKGTWLAFRRIMRCHPFHPGGFDPVRK